MIRFIMSAVSFFLVANMAMAQTPVEMKATKDKILLTAGKEVTFWYDSTGKIVETKAKMLTFPRSHVTKVTLTPTETDEPGVEIRVPLSKEDTTLRIYYDPKKISIRIELP